MTGSNEIDDEISDSDVGKDLYEVMTKNMIRDLMYYISSNEAVLRNGEQSSHQLGMPSPNRSAVPFDVELCCEQNYNTTDLLSYMRQKELVKILLIRLIWAVIRFQNKMVLVLASSGIAATLVPVRRTHSAMKLPLNVQFIETSICNTSKTSAWEKQILRVISRSTPLDEKNACLKYSTLWQHLKMLKLTTNMRVPAAKRSII
ncbi:unnamed protein product [Onchocerca ochengi]|uniref:ATP-dependent DNA helicase n=1 Tax=Onchocerca ochengi TaxID=42157 RepID=A0A182EIX8_ONCOC|nr:unnamed protein product [Onchocerca ochengi]